MSKTGMLKKRYARDIALRILFGQADTDSVREALSMIIEDLSEQRSKPVMIDKDDERFVFQLVDGVKTHTDEIDSSISAHSPDWKPSRMSRVDLCVLRLGVYELLYSDTPDKVCINEAVELAKKYGSDKSPRFINGILGGIFKSRLKHKSEVDYD